MARRRKRPRLVIDTMAVVRGARALRQKSPAPNTPELLLILSWIEDEGAFDRLFCGTILEEYREVLRRLKVPRNAVGRFINLLREAGALVEVKGRGEYSPDRRPAAAGLLRSALSVKRLAKRLQWMTVSSVACCTSLSSNLVMTLD